MVSILIDRLTPCDSPRTQVHDLVAQLAESIEQLGMLSPLIVIRDKTRWFWRVRPHRYIVVCGNLRLKALKILGRKSAPCSIVDATVENSLLYYNTMRSRP